MAKRIQMRKNRFLALQKMAEQKKNEAMNASNAAMNDGGPPDHHGIPKQTVSLSIFHFKWKALSGNGNRRRKDFRKAFPKPL